LTEEEKRHRVIMSAAMRAKWAASMMRSCPHPAVKETYGTDQVSVWICKSCAYAHRYKWHGGISCDYKNEENAE